MSSSCNSRAEPERVSEAKSVVSTPESELSVGDTRLSFDSGSSERVAECTIALSSQGTSRVSETVINDDTVDSSCAVEVSGPSSDVSVCDEF